MHRRTLPVLAAACLAATAAGAQQLVPVAPGRTLHVTCTGQGAPTVVLSAGGGGASGDWRRVQPVVAQTTRVCAWDRAASGLSSASPEPQDLVHTEADLERALDGAGVTGPLVMVGHSYGGLETLRFADRHPERVVGLVLVDPSYPDQVDRLAAAAPALMAWSTAGDRAAFEPVRRCVEAAGSPAACAAVRARRPQAPAADLAYWQTVLSAFDERARNAKQAINPRRTYGSLPLVVLGSGLLALPGASPEIRAEVPALQAERERAQTELSRLSTRGSYRHIPDSGHAIMLQKPTAVTDAILEVVQAARKG